MYNVKVSAEKKAKIKEGMIGLFFEDINYAADGGLYCEMLENYNFEALEATGDFDDYHTVYDGLYGWEPYPYDGTGAMLETFDEGGVSRENPHYLVFTASEEQLGFSNKAYDGIYLNKGEKYRVSLYMRRHENYDGAVYGVIDTWGEVIQSIELSPSMEGSDINKEWQKIDIEFTAEEDVSAGTFAIMLEYEGTVDFDFISLKPENAVCKVFRRDLARKLKALKPGFLRFPGGCIVEGNTLDNRYQWKKSVGKREDRKNNWNRWAVHGNNKENNFTGIYSHYNQTLGLGYYEYFILCEYLNCEPLPVMNVGLACQYQSTELVDTGDEKFQEFIQDALDLIEFANGDEASVWGKVRCEMGHQEPFNLKMIGIGNEQWETEKVDFFKRYDMFEAAIHEKYPDMRLIGSAGPNVEDKYYDAAWSFYREKKNSLEKPIEKYVYAIDEHYYRNPDWMLKKSHFYDDYPRDIKVFAGEYAAHVVPGAFNNPSSNNLYAGLCEAAFMTGIERNADVVELASYAPLFARIDYTQWSPDMIWFDGKSSYATPSYYVQQLYSVYTGKYTLDINTPEELSESLYTSASFDDEENKLYIKLVNVTDNDMEINLDLRETAKLMGKEILHSATEIVLTGSKEDVNSISELDKIKPICSNIIIDEKYTLKGNSFTVLIF